MYGARCPYTKYVPAVPNTCTYFHAGLLDNEPITLFGVKDMSMKSSTTRRNRSPVEIIVTILEACKEGGTKRSIMFRSFLDYRQVSKYVKVLAQHQYIQTGADERYWLTDKGVQAFQELNKTLATLRDVMERESDSVAVA